MLKSFIIKKIVLLIILSLSLCQTCETAEECDFVKCFATVKSFFAGLRKPGTPFICKNLLNSSWCSESCMYSYFPNIPKNSNVNRQDFIQHCNENIVTRNANWSCISQHGLRLLTCLSNVSSLTTNSVRSDMLLLESCRKSFEFQNCPAEVLSECGEISVDVVKDLLEYIITNFLYSCKATKKKEIKSMPVFYHLGQEYMEAAKSMDYYYNFITDCYDEHIRDEIDLNSFLCQKNDNLDSCISYTLEIRRKPFPAVKRLLFKYFMLGNIKCNEPESGIKPIPLQPQSSTEVVKSNGEIDSSQHSVLSDENNGNAFIFPESSQDSEEPKSKNFKLGTESTVGSTSEEISDRIDHSIPTRKISDGKDAHSLPKNISKPTPSYSDTNTLKASSAFNFNCDKTLFVVLFVLFLL